jgi:hypothetical protein
VGDAGQSKRSATVRLAQAIDSRSPGNAGDLLDRAERQAAHNFRKSYKSVRPGRWSFEIGHCRPAAQTTE